VIEEQELKRTEFELLEIFNENQSFKIEDLCNIHELWLGDIYPFAGKYRAVNMSKGDFIFLPLLLGFLSS
jgi:cell filamentation protein